MSIFRARAQEKIVNRDVTAKEIRPVNIDICFGLVRVQTLLSHLLSDLVYKTLSFKWVAAF